MKEADVVKIIIGMCEEIGTTPSELAGKIAMGKIVKNMIVLFLMIALLVLCLRALSTAVRNYGGWYRLPPMLTDRLDVLLWEFLIGFLVIAIVGCVATMIEWAIAPNSALVKEIIGRMRIG